MNSTSFDRLIRGRLSLLALIAFLACLLLAAAPAPARAAITAAPRLDRAMLAQAKAEGTVRVIVGLNTPFAPENERVAPATAQAQRDGIQRTQDAVLQRLAGRELAALTRFASIPYMALSVDAATLEALAADPGVAAIEEDSVGTFTADNIGQIGGTVLGFGTGDYSGKGRTIAIIDSGVMKTHAFLQQADGSPKVVSEACYSAFDASISATSVCPGGVTSSTAAGSGVNCAVTTADCDHGTMVAGIAAGHSFAGQQNGPINGVAKDATLIAIQAASQVNSTAICGARQLTTPCAVPLKSNVLLGLDRVFQLRNSFGISAVNLSIGFGSFAGFCDSDPQLASFKAAIDSLHNVGIPTIVAAGNDSATNTVNAPACIQKAMPVSAVNKLGQVKGDANMSPVIDLLAPGEAANTALTLSTTKMGFGDGTSMATPHVAGAFAVFQSAQTGAMPIDSVLATMQSTGTLVSDTRAGGTQTKALLNLRKAVDQIAPACQDAADKPGSDPLFNDNDTLLTADPIAVDGPGVAQYFCSKVDEDWVKFDALANKTYQVDAAALTQGNDTTIEVWYDTGTTALFQQVTTNDDNDAGTYGSRATFTPFDNRPFFVRVRPAVAGIGGSTAFGYTVKVTTLGQPCKDADDDIAAKALPFTVSTTQAKGLCDSTDQDWVKFQVTKPNTTLRIETLNLGMGQSLSKVWSVADTMLDLYGDPAAAPLASDDDIHYFPNDFRVRSSIEYTFATVGTYFVKVTRFGNLGGDGQTYNLRITRLDKATPPFSASLVSGAQAQSAKSAPAAPPVSRQERAAADSVGIAATCPEDTAETTGDGNDTAAAADLLGFNQTQQHYFCSASDQDWFTFVVGVDEGLQQQLETLNLSPNNDTLVEVFSDQGQTPVRFNDDSDDGGYASRVVFTPQVAGTYYARVRPAAPGVGGDASFSYAVRYNAKLNACGNNEPDDNALGGQAKDFTMGSLRALALCTSGDNDWVRFKVTKPNTSVRIETLNLAAAQTASGAWGMTDTVLDLHASLLNPPLASNDDWQGPARRSLIEYSFPTAGTYFVRVRPFSSGGPGQAYELRISRIERILPDNQVNAPAPGLRAAPDKTLAK